MVGEMFLPLSYRDANQRRLQMCVESIDGHIRFLNFSQYMTISLWIILFAWPSLLIHIYIRDRVAEFGE